jgi:hypothetical protein
MKTRKFGHGDAMAIRMYLQRIEYTPTLEQLITNCGLSGVQVKGIKAWLEGENIELTK